MLPFIESLDIRPRYEVNQEINSRISILPQGDSGNLKVDAVVNAANSQLMPGGGICGRIHSVAGPQLWKECSTKGYVKTGGAVKTGGYNLPARFCIHAVGPIGVNPKELADAYRNTLRFIDGKDIKSIGLCCISTGIYGYPIEQATPVALEVVREFLEIEENRKKTERIIFVVYEQRDVSVYLKYLPVYFPKTEVKSDEPEIEGDKKEEFKIEDDKKEVEVDIIAKEKVESRDVEEKVKTEEVGVDEIAKEEPKIEDDKKEEPKIEDDKKEVEVDIIAKEEAESRDVEEKPKMEEVGGDLIAKEEPISDDTKKGDFEVQDSKKAEIETEDGKKEDPESGDSLKQKVGTEDTQKKEVATEDHRKEELHETRSSSSE